MPTPKTTTVSYRTAGGISYQLTRRKVKNINLRIRTDGSVAVSAAPRVPLHTIDAFVAERADWIAAAQAKLAARNAAQNAEPLPTKAEAVAYFEHLSEMVFPAFETLLEGQKPTIKVRDMSTRWGVCHITKRQITFALKLYNMPPAAQIYVVVHEYCHFLQANHSPAFWAEVESILPDWKARRKLLR